MKLLLSKIFLVSIFCFLLTSNVSAQKGSDALKTAEREWKKLFDESVEWYNFGYYDNALRGFKRLLIKDRNHCNVNFYVAMCYYYLQRPADIILPYMEKAAKKVNPYYSYTYKENSSPVFTLLYVGELYMYLYRFDDAEKAFSEFKTYLTERNRDAAHIMMVEQWSEYVKNARELYANPVVNMSVENLKIANSNYNETSPFLSPDGKTLFISSDRKGSTGGQFMQNTFKSDVYIMTNKSGHWSKPKKMAYRINSNSADNNSTVGENGKYLIFSREDKNNKDFNIYSSEIDGKRFRTPEKFNPNINTKSNETHAYISVNGNVMYFASNKPGGYGGTDIYLSEKMPNGEWGPAYNLGPNVNTIYDDDFPYILDDGVTLFFSSKGHNSMGGFDIFVTTLSEEGIWSDPENIGYPVNTTSDDTGFMMNKDGSTGYYSTAREAQSNASVGNADIYQISFGQ
ncbi:MAG: hypothetical protein CVU11_13050 [Bacteroidetes bacterium HGW-Bacteroidetes-6]|nr:MAG: hypothetical protein CVU11_13050 [Bacteroidetes bacterium HGW-Bacteroidetes-6]